MQYNIKPILLLLLSTFFLYQKASATTFTVHTLFGFSNAQNSAMSGDTILWEEGTYTDYILVISKSGLMVGARTPGATIFNGRSKLKITGDNIVFTGVQYVGGNIGFGVDLIKLEGSNCILSQLNIKDYFCQKYLVVDEDSQNNTIIHCNFENRTFIGDKNILSILVNENNPGYHKIQWCSFKNFEGEGLGKDFGVEPIRIGLGSQATFNSRSLVEYCYFTQCNGDGEIISNKSAQNIYRFNTFDDNPYGEVTLRTGDQAVVYGNFFLNGLGGVRVKEGQNHTIFNNYFQNLDSRAIQLQNFADDPLNHIHILFNTIVDSGPIILNDKPNEPNPPSNIILANNIFVNSSSNEIFTNPTEQEQWISNLASGNIGIPTPIGVQELDPLLIENGKDIFNYLTKAQQLMQRYPFQVSLL